MTKQKLIKFHRQQIRHHQQKLAELLAPDLGQVLFKISKSSVNKEST